MKKILIVDDAAFMQKVTSAMLAPKYKTFCASSGAEALEMYEKVKPDLILTDLLMPEMTGFELQQKLQERYHEQIPIMFMTADENEDNESQGLAAGAMDYIRKPFKQDLLLLRVENIMRHMDRIAGLKMVAEADPMTGLLNKVNAQKTLAEICVHANGILMMVDLDSFKLVNDLYGHGMGDRILIRFAEILKSVIRSSDVAGRMGGDEFIVFCKDIKDEEIVADKARRINESLLASAKEFMGEDFGIPLGASIGAVAVPEEGTDFYDLYQKADKALYRVKQHGKHGYSFYRSDTAQTGESAKSVNTSIQSIQMILEERNRAKGAYGLSMDGFQHVYRYAVRCVENYHNKMALVLFSLHTSQDSDLPEEDVADLFGQVLQGSLRRSDVFTKNGKNQFITLLTSIPQENTDIVLHRILDNWSKSEHSGLARVEYEQSMIEV
ncbi:MAG: diguanylate cyclase [Oscillospiraceae bacterium]|nr:diguanylate cyclase [Oscillospiraceae bacterium]